jgi:hypothetical protein
MGQRGNIMKKLILIILFISFPLYAQNPFMASDGRGPYKDSNCDQAKYYPIGKLCADTDDGKLYKGTGAAVSEIAAGSSGDVAGPAASTAGEVVLFDGISGKIIKRSNTLSGFPQLTSGILSAKDAENTRTDLGLGALSTVTPGANVATFLATPNSSNFFGMISDEGNFISTLWDDADASTARTTLGLAIGTNVQAYDADLTTWAGITQGSGVGTFLATPSSANFFSMVTGETGSGAVVGGTAPGFTTSANPASADGATLGTTALEWSDIYFADGGVIYGQNDQSATLTSSASLWTANNFSVTTQFKLPSSNADPTATAGYFRHDSTITNFTNGGLVYYNGAAIKQLVDMTTATASACTDDQVVAYDADNDLWYCKNDSTGAGASGTLTTIKEATAQVGGADIVTLDFGAGFDLTESPDTEINIAIDLGELDLDDLPGDTTDNNLIDQAIIEGMAASATPGIRFTDSDASATGTVDIYADATTAGQDSVQKFYVDDSTGEDTQYFEIDGVNEVIDALKPLNVPAEAYNATNWDADTSAPQKDAVRDQFEAEPAATRVFTNKTLDANATGNVLKGYGYITFTKPHNRGSATGAVGTTETTQLYGVPSFADDVETNNFVDYIAEVPRDWDSAVDPVAYFKFRLGGADTADHDYIVSMIDIADSAAAAGTPGDAINLAYTADGSGADGDIETATATLTGWGSAATAGAYWLIRVTRDGDDGTNDASTVDSYPMELTIRYGFTQ